MAVTWDQVLAWRMGRQWLTSPTNGDAFAVVQRLAGVQAQVLSSAAAGIASRQVSPAPGEVDRLLAARSLVRTWAMRGTLHLLAAAEAGAYLSLLAAAKTWESGSWQRNFLNLTELRRLAEVVGELLDGAVLTRAELVAGIVERTGDERLGDQVASGWAAVLKPLAWQGVLCQGPSTGGRVTFAAPASWIPGWRGLPGPEEAARLVVPAYLGAYGPASAATFDQWLTRGRSPKARLRRWFSELGDRLAVVVVDGQELVARAEDVDDLHAARCDSTVRLLPAFGQYVLGPGTTDVHSIPPLRRSAVSKAAGWISPVVVAHGRVVGTWDMSDQRLAVTLFGEEGQISRPALDREMEAIAGGRAVSVTTV